MPKVDSITIEGFKSIGKLECLSLGPINVLIGSNGSGKSNFVEAFSLLQTIRAGNLQSYVARSGGADRILHFGAKRTEFLIVRVSFETGESGVFNEYKIILASTQDDRLYPISESVYFWDKNKYPQPLESSISGT